MCVFILLLWCSVIKIQLLLDYCSCQSIDLLILSSLSSITLSLHCNCLTISSFFSLSFSYSSNLSLKHFIDFLISMSCSSSLIWLSFAFSRETTFVFLHFANSQQIMLSNPEILNLVQEHLLQELCYLHVFSCHLHSQTGCSTTIFSN